MGLHLLSSKLSSCKSSIALPVEPPKIYMPRRGRKEGGREGGKEGY